jgi:hypothetical protein
MAAVGRNLSLSSVQAGAAAQVVEGLAATAGRGRPNPGPSVAAALPAWRADDMHQEA